MNPLLFEEKQALHTEHEMTAALRHALAIHTGHPPGKREPALQALLDVATRLGLKTVAQDIRELIRCY